MALDTANEQAQHAAKKAIQSYSDWAGHVSYLLYELAYQARAARALLHEHDETEQNETLTGVSYLLSRLAADGEKLSDQVSETCYTFVRKESGQEASHV